jgi:hypothetical protein
LNDFLELLFLTVSRTDLRREIEKLLPDIEFSSVKQALKNYAKEGRPFALPKFNPQDLVFPQISRHSS